MEKRVKSKKLKKKIKIENKEGLTVSYNRKELYEIFPNLAKEVFEKKKSLKINSINGELEQINKDTASKFNGSYPKELYNPEAIDFIRRCKTKDEAINILDYLLRKNEITIEEYNHYSNIISQEGGLDNLINESGGFKRPGYYMKKYYKEKPKNQKINNKND